MAGANDQVVVANDSSFQKVVLESDVPVLVDFWAPWCGPCRAIAPVVSEISNSYAGRAKVVKVNTDESQQVAAQFQIMSIPTLLMFKGGKVVGQHVGGGSSVKGKLTALVDKALA